MQLLKPGLDLDALIAAKIFGEPQPTYVDEDGLHHYLSGNPAKSEGGRWLLLFDYEKGDLPEWTPLPFSQEISVAWQVVEHFADYNVQLDGQGERWTFHIFKDAVCHEWTSETAPLAICLAALKATEAEAI